MLMKVETERERESWQKSSVLVILTLPRERWRRTRQKKSDNLKHVNNMCLTQTAKSNSLLTLPQPSPRPLSINHLPLPSSFSTAHHRPPTRPFPCPLLASVGRRPPEQMAVCQ